MCADSGSVLIAGDDEGRVARVAGALAGVQSVRTFVTTDHESWPTTDVEVVLFLGRATADDPALGALPDDAGRILVLEDADEYDRDHQAAYDRVLLEPLIPDDLRSTVTSLARRVRYGRRLQECAELATRCGRVESNGNGGVMVEPHQLRDEIADAKAEIDSLVAEFSTEDFRQAFQTLAAD